MKFRSVLLSHSISQAHSRLVLLGPEGVGTWPWLGLFRIRFYDGFSPVLASSARHLSRKGVGILYTGIEDGTLEPFGFQKSGRITWQVVHALQSGSCKKYQLAQMWMLYCFAQ
jgi:hypothetical protein